MYSDYLYTHTHYYTLPTTLLVGGILLHLLIRSYAGYRKHYKQTTMQIETLKVQHTVQPEEQLSQSQWMEQYFAGARLKPEVHVFTCPLETYLKYIDNLSIRQNN